MNNGGFGPFFFDMNNKLTELALIFFRLGTFAFGGPAAHIAMMEEEFVSKRAWLSREHFLDLVGATNLIPGPNSTEMTMHIGHERAGIAGLFIAGLCFITPAVLITALLGWIYVTYGQLPEVAPFFKGIQPAVIAIVASAILKLGKKALKNVELGVLGAIVVGLTLWGINEIAALLGAGLLGMLYFYTRHKQVGQTRSFIPFVIAPLSSTAIGTISTLKIFLIFLKVGAVLYGSGYVLFAYLDAELVQTGILKPSELMDAVAVGQFTPGPVLSTATFVGFQIGGFWGAIAATAGIFLPSFLFVFLLNPLVPKMRKSTLLRGFLDSVNIASVAVMITVLIHMTLSSILEWRSALIMVLSLIAVFAWKKISSMWIVLGGSLLGYVLYTWI